MSIMAGKASVIGESTTGIVGGLLGGGKQLICLRDLTTKHRVDSGLSPQSGLKLMSSLRGGDSSPPHRRQSNAEGGNSPQGSTTTIAKPSSSSSTGSGSTATVPASPTLSDSGHQSPMSPSASAVQSNQSVSSSTVTVPAALPLSSTGGGRRSGSGTPPIDLAQPSASSAVTDGRSSPTASTGEGAATGSGANSDDGTTSGGGAANQLNKLKRFLSTVQQFADDISPDIGDRVRALVLALVNSQMSVEEFHRRLQETTNFPLRPFVVPFLKVRKFSQIVVATSRFGSLRTHSEIDANLPLLQQELQSTTGAVLQLQVAPATVNGTGRRSASPRSPPPHATTSTGRSVGLLGAGDQRPVVPLPLSVRTAALGPPDPQRHPLWYLGPGGMIPNAPTAAAAPPGLGRRGNLLQPRNGLDFNANGKRPSAFDRLNESPIDLKLDVLAPVPKRLHIDIPGLPSSLQVPPPPPPSAHQSQPRAGSSHDVIPFVINPASVAAAAAAAGALLRADDLADRDRLHQHQLRVSGGGDRTGPNSLCRPTDGHSNNNVEDVEEEWQNLDSILQNIVAMVERCRRSMASLKENCRRSHHVVVAGMTPGSGPVNGSSPGNDVSYPGSLRIGADDMHILQVRQLAEEAVNEVKRQAVAELHRAVAAAEVKATVTVTAERARLEKVINEVRTQARQEAFSLLNSQEDSTENCWNCGRKAYETCSGCHRARYCGTFCQHRHWETHHLTCRPSTNATAVVGSDPTGPAVGVSSADRGGSGTSSSSSQRRTRQQSMSPTYSEPVDTKPPRRISSPSRTAHDSDVVEARRRSRSPPAARTSGRGRSRSRSRLSSSSPLPGTNGDALRQSGVVDMVVSQMA